MLDEAAATQDIEVFAQSKIELAASSKDKIFSIPQLPKALLTSNFVPFFNMW